MLNWLFAWYNFPFLIALGLGLVFALLQIVGGFGDSDSDADMDADADGDVDADGDADGDFFGNVLDGLGVGKVPLMFILVSFLCMFGLVGLLLNTIVAQNFTYASIAFLIVLILSFMLAFVITGRTSRLFAKLAPDTSTAVGFEQLVGRVGRVSSNSLSTTYGRVEVRDQFGSLQTVYAVVQGGDSLPEHTEVALLEYDQTRRCYIAKQMRD